MTESRRLYRFGLESEDTEKLAREAAQAIMHGFPHGVSVFDRTSRTDVVSALQWAVEAYFKVIKTGRNPYHYTIELPESVTDEVAALFNHLFGRR